MSGPPFYCGWKFLVIEFTAAGLLTWAFVLYWDRAENRGFCKRVYYDAEDAEYLYQIYVPRNYKRTDPCPLILFLHGAGQSGDDGIKPIEAGLAPAIRQREDSFPFLAVFPQSHELSWDADRDDARRAQAILGDICRNYSVDPDRIYLTGMSMGGGGVWSIAAAYPDRWAAIVPVCGYGDPASTAQFAEIPCWCFHGTLDNVIPVEQSRAMVRALRQAGGQPRYTEYPSVGHAAWNAAYADDELYDWLLRQRRIPLGGKSPR